MTEAERQAKVAQLERLQKLQQLQELQAMKAQQQPAPAPVAEPEPEKAPLNALNTLRGGLQKAVQGQTANWGDEIIGMGRALVDPLIAGATGNAAAIEEMTGQKAPGVGGVTENSWDMYAEDERANMDQFDKENPKTGFGLELAGGFASPINFVAPGSGALSKGAHFTQRLRQGTGRGIIEGAIAGAGNADEDRLGGALLGGTLGAVLPAGINVAVKEPWRQFTKRRIAQDMFEVVRDASGTVVRKFKTPIHMTGEHSTLVDLYRQVVGRAWGGKQKLGAQEAPIIAAAKKNLDNVTENTRTLTRTLGKMKREATVDAKRASAAIDETYNQDVASVNRAIREATEAGDAERVAQLTSVKEMVDAGIEKEATDLRALAATEAMPEDARLDILFPNGVDGPGAIDVNDPTAVSNRLIDWWRKDGFKMVKERDFDWDGNLGEAVAREFGDDPGLTLALDDAPGLIRALEKRFGMTEALEALRKGQPTDQGLQLLNEVILDPTVKINGDALMDLRNVFAKAAGRGGDKGWAYKKIRDQFDSLIKRQLDAADPALTAAFEDQLRRWPKRLTYTKAVAAAQDARGMFQPKQYSAAAKSVAGEEATARGTTPLYDEANTALERQGILTATGDTATEQARLDKTLAGDILGAEKEARLTAAKARQALAKDEVDARRDSLIEGMNITDKRDAAAAVLRGARNNARDVAARGIPAKASGLSSLLTTLLLSGGGAGLGAKIGGPMGAAVGLGVGGSVASGLAEPSVQMALAGQLRGQELGNLLLNRLNKSAVAPAVQRTLTREIPIEIATEE